MDFINIKISTVNEIFGFFLLDSAVNSLNWLNNNLRFGGGLNVNIILLFVYFHTGFIQFRVIMYDRKKILIFEVFERKCFITGTFKAKPGVIVIATNPLTIKKT